MRSKIVAMMVFIWVGSATAADAYFPDQIGVFFDVNAENPCLTVQPNVPFMAYVMILNPSSTEVRGVEYSLCAELPAGYEGQFIFLSETWPVMCPPPLTLEYLDPCADGRFIDCSSPVPQVGAKVIMTEMEFMLTGDFNVDFYLGPASLRIIGDGMPAYIGQDDEVLPLGYASGSADLPVASVNGGCRAVPAARASFGEVKALFR